MSGSAVTVGIDARPAVEEVRSRGEYAVRLRSGRTSATFLPGHGLTGVSLRHAGGEYLAFPGGLDALRVGRTTGLPLLAPWANRLSSNRYRFGGRDVDLTSSIEDGTVRTDGTGLPIHGLLAGRSRWTVESTRMRRDAASLRASTVVDSPAFPFPHRILVTATVRDSVLVVDTSITPTARRRVPVMVGWHPYLRVPGTARNALRLRLPAMTHLLLDERGIPTGRVEPAGRADAVVGSRTFDDLYALRARSRVAALHGEDGRSVTVRFGSGYPYAQVWVPRGRPFASLEPMSAPTDALTTGELPVVAPGEVWTGRFAIELT